MDLLIQLILLMPIGFLFGSIAEKKHLKSLEEREKKNVGFKVFELKTFPSISANSKTPKLFIGEVTVASDYYKRFAGGLKNFLGGEILSYSILMTRARREALLRIIEGAKAEGYNAICNLRMETADIGGSATTSKAAVMVSIIAYATAYDADEQKSEQ